MFNAKKNRYHNFGTIQARIAQLVGGGSIRLNLEGRINKNQKAENKKPEGRTRRPNNSYPLYHRET